jgi:DNA adenine methylase
MDFTQRTAINTSILMASPHLIQNESRSSSKEERIDRPIQISAFLRWAGGKRQLLPILVAMAPPDYLQRAYHEPFLGAGSLFLALRPNRGVLADANQALIDTYKWVRAAWYDVAFELSKHSKATSERYYYRIRAEYNKGRSSPRQAARFIYLNKTCFNGIFRVNTQGAFNVPYGWKEPPAVPTAAHLAAISAALAPMDLRGEDFQMSLKRPAAGDFVYLDPPYPPLNGTSYFTHYTEARFNRAHQLRLGVYFRRLSDIGCRVLMSNADTKLVRGLYSDFTLRTTPVIRYISCKKKRHSVQELLISNY